jgi:hypothetical protein
MNRLFINCSQRIALALRDPSYAARFLVREVLASDERFPDAA